MEVIEIKNNKATVYYNGKYYWVSDNGEETLIFNSNSSGKILDWTDVGGAKEVSLHEVLNDFSRFIYNW